MRVFLETERLLLRRFAWADVDSLLALHNDPEVMRFLNGGKRTSREEVEREYREHFAGDGYWAAVEKATGGFVGWFAFHPTEGGGPEGYELGYRLERSAWGKGYATEGSLALIRKGFAELGVRRVWAQTMAINLASRRVMEKAGLVYVRTFHLEWEDPLPGTEHGEVEYALTRDDWGREAGGPGRRVGRRSASRGAGPRNPSLTPGSIGFPDGGTASRRRRVKQGGAGRMRDDRDVIPKGLKAERLSIERGSTIIHAASVGPSASCPVCGRPSRRVHSSYERAVADLPWHGAAVTLRVRARRFFCDRASCPRRIFCERLPNVAAHSRKTGCL